MSDAVSELKAELAAISAKPSSARALRSPRNLPPSRRNGGGSASSLETSSLTDRTGSRRDRSKGNRPPSSSRVTESSGHSRSASGSFRDLDDISESDTGPPRARSSRRSKTPSADHADSTTSLNDSPKDGLARAKDRLLSRRQGGSSSTSVSSARGSRRHNSDLGASHGELSVNTSSSGHSRSRRRHPPRGSKSNDNLDIMSMTIDSSEGSGGVSRTPRTPMSARRTAPSRSKSAGTSIRARLPSADASLLRVQSSDSAATGGLAPSTEGKADDDKTNRSRRSRSKDSRRSRRGSSRSRSKSRGAKKRHGSRLAQIPQENKSDSSKAKAEQDRINAILNIVGKEAPPTPTEDQGPKTVSSTSTRVRRKGSNGKASLGAGLSMLDSLTPRPRIRDAKSVGAELQSPRKRTIPTRGVQRTSSQDGGGISSLAAFLDASPKKSNKLSSSRSVGADPSMTPGGGGGGSKKPTRRRLKKSTKKGGSDDASTRSSRSRGGSSSASVGGGVGAAKRRAHSSLSSGLDLQSASSVPFRGRKPGRSNSRTTEDIDESLHVDDLLGVVGSSSNSKVRRGTKGGSTKGTASTAVKRLSRSVDDMDFNASGLGLMLAQEKENSRLDGGKSIFLDGMDDEKMVQEDIFVFYTWSTSHQARQKQQTNRLILNETLRQGTFLKAFEAYCGKQGEN